ncbi:polyadenylate-binding protein-interacting protein 2 [Chrysoperla carnea]|uniref:polyadenylate-binding protein-interacting protein 2 n=1 Tax=Chrysoperla carnea TaxID=189513 RepID=UPI001D06341B|nr:polyadenylate-binding protein-interacting protein 2 [Chrysoperla carnea]
MKIPTNTMQLFDEISTYSESVHTTNGNYYSEPDDHPVLDGDFSEYMWMENEEQFDRQVMAELEEEELIEQCMEAMLEDELQQSHNQSLNSTNLPSTQGQNDSSSSNNEDDILSLCDALDKVSTSYSVDKSTLNPLAAEFVPGSRVNTQQSTHVTSASAGV